MACCPRLVTFLALGDTNQMTGVAASVGRPLRQSDPAELGPYALLRRLGEGGMGSVYLAQKPDGPLVALKMIRHDLASDPDFRRRFRSEVARAKQVPAYCTAEVLDADSDFDPPYLVVEFVKGPSLNRVVQEQGSLSPANLHGLAIGVATALTGIHGAGVIHRDLKPANVLLSLAGPKVIDFGIARAPEGTALTDTGSNQLIGTIPYMAPERLDPGLNLPLTSAADVFSWGAVVCFAGTGRTPFSGGNGIETAARILTQPPDLSGLTGLIRDLVERALAKNPADRPTARELLDELVGTSARIEAASKQAVVTVAPVSTDTTRLAPGVAVAEVVTHAPRKRRKVAIPLLTAATVLLAAAVGGFLSGAIRPPFDFGLSPVSTPSVLDTPTPMPTATPSPSVTPAVSPTATPVQTAKPAFIEVSLASDTASWKSKDEMPLGKCTVKNGMTAHIERPGTYRCPGAMDELRDMSAEVDVSLHKPEACAAIWTRFSNLRGYLLEVCHNRYALYLHQDNQQPVVRTKDLASPIPMKTKFKVKIVLRGSQIAIFHNGQEMMSVLDSSFDKGTVRLGISVPVNPGNLPYDVTFSNLVIHDLAS